MFDMIHQHNLLDFVQDKIVKLMEIDTKVGPLILNGYKLPFPALGFVLFLIQKA